MEAEKKFVGGYVSEELKLELDKIAKAEDRSMTYILEKILTEGVKHRAGKSKKAA